MMEKSPESDADLRRLEQLSNLMDNQFPIPGTNFRFGLDGLLGLIPYVGDLSGLLVSGVLVRTMAKKGAGVGIILQMMGNILLDAMVGFIPILGDFFDFGFKANRRNVQLLKKYYASGKPRPNAKWSLFFLSILMLLVFFGLFWLTFQGFGMVWNFFKNL